APYLRGTYLFATIAVTVGVATQSLADCGLRNAGPVKVCQQISQFSLVHRSGFWIFRYVFQDYLFLGFSSHMLWHTGITIIPISTGRAVDIRLLHIPWHISWHISFAVKEGISIHFSDCNLLLKFAVKR